MSMKIKSFLARPFASYIYKSIHKGMTTAVGDQEAIFKELLRTGSKTLFGGEHHMGEIRNYEEFRQAVPVRDYEQFAGYIHQIKEGRHNVLWQGRPIYLAKTSGTTSGVKYIPISKDSISNHINTARNALLCYMAETGNTSFSDGKMIFLSGTPELERIGGIPTGRLSGIVDWGDLTLGPFAIDHSGWTVYLRMSGRIGTGLESLSAPVFDNFAVFEAKQVKRYNRP